MTNSMVGLINGLVHVKDALSLTAFLALVLLGAFRTKRVPELFFGLLRDKLTRQQFAMLLNRFMTLGFAAFLALLALAVTSQVLSHLTTPSALTVGDLRNELAKTSQSVEDKIHAEAQYTLAMEKLGQRDFDGAIAALNNSINSIPTLTAKEMLIYLYRQKGDLADASKAWEEAVKTARQSGDTLALARLDNIAVPSGIPSAEGEHDLIGASTALPKGGDRYETATTLPEGFYSCSNCNLDELRWYKTNIDAGQNVRIKIRGALSGWSQASIFGTNGQILRSTDITNAGVINEIDWAATESGWYYLRYHSSNDGVLRLEIH